MTYKNLAPCVQETGFISFLSDVIKKGDIRKNISLNAPESAKKERFNGHDLFAYYQLQNPVIKTLINHEFLSNDGEDIFNYIDFAILTQDFIKEDDDGGILLPQRQLEIYNEHKQTFETKRYSSTHDRELQTNEEDIENLIQISNGLETIMCILFPTYAPEFDFNSSCLEKEIKGNIFDYYHLKKNIAKPIRNLDKITSFYLKNEFTKKEFENLLNSLTQINKDVMLDDQTKEIFRNIYLNLCIYLKHCSVEGKTGIYFSEQVFRRIKNYCKIVMNSNLFNIKGEQLRHSTYFINNKSKLETTLMKTKNEFKQTQQNDNVKSTISQKIMEFIDILNSGNEDALKQHTTCLFKDGTSTGPFWHTHKDLIIEKLCEDFKDDPTYDTARNIVNETLFNLNTDAKIMMFIKMLNDKNINILRAGNREVFKDYPNIKIGRFWQQNKNKIKEMLFEKLIDDPTYDTARACIIQEKIKENKFKDFLISLGYTDEIASKIIKHSPYIIYLGKEYIIRKIKEIMDLGYSKEETIHLTKYCPTIFALSIDNIKEKISGLENLGYSLEEIKKITKEVPSIFALNIDVILEKKKFFDSIGLPNIFVENPGYLMQSVELSYARYKFYNSIGIIIDEKNYNLLFISSESFKKIYNIDKSLLLEKYKKIDNFESNNRKR